ncbi:helix-turn-helix transcriptional regulator [Aneurinibacillus tyrosinisolvens]|uniref:helix-turn-helix transcriptional regulator n=1 Tax=Aneurinibacillus tyrosinisolvens TaxID=1443435 RepID=UPI00063F203D|nr:helix-turn-helix transcriptional regulator [Aneurinibacillus tyrosinisolvens]
MEKQDIRMNWKLQRVKKGIKVKEIAQILKVSSAFISRYERAQVDMRISNEKLYRKFIENY